MKKYLSVIFSVSFLFASISSYAVDDIPLSRLLILNYDAASEAMGASIGAMSSNSFSFTNMPSSNFSIFAKKLGFAATAAYHGIYGGAASVLVPSKYGNFAAAASYTDLNDLGNLPGTNSLTGFYLNYVYPISTDIPVYADIGGLGLTIKGYQFKVNNESKMSFLADIGGHYYLGNILSGLWAFAALRNLGSNIETDYETIEIPGNFTLALRYNIPLPLKPAVTFDAMKFFKDEFGYSFGFEIMPVYPVTLKAGWRDYGDYINRGPTAGLFLDFDSFNLGYSFSGLAKGYSPKHTINFSFLFGSIYNENKAYDYYLGYNFNMAKETYKRKDYVSARQQLEEILAIYPDHQPSKELLKQLIYDLDVYDRNIEIQLNKWLRRADLALHRNNLIKARNYYYRVLGIDPENTEAESGLAQVNAKLYKVSIQENRKKYEKEIISLYGEAMAFYNKGQFVFAKEKFNQILEIDPENAGALKYLSVIETQVTKVTDLHADKMFTQGMEYYNMADYERAAQYFNAVYASDPKRTDAKEYYDLSRKALSSSINEKSSKSKSSGRRVADKDDSLLSSNQKIQKSMELYFDDAVSLFNNGKYEESLKAFVELREKALKNNYYDLNRQIREYTAKAKTSLSERYFKEAVAFIKIDKGEEAVEKLKKSLEYDKDYAPALREYEKLTSDLAQKYYEMGIKSYSSGQKKRAVDYLTKSLEYNPKKIESKKALDRIKSLGE